MKNTGTRLNKYHFTRFCVAVPIPTENTCFPPYQRFQKSMRPIIQIKGNSNYDFWMTSHFSNCYLCPIKLKLTFEGGGGGRLPNKGRYGCAASAKP